MTHRLQTAVILLFAAIAFAAMTQSALADWLIDGSAIKETLATTSEEELTLEDSKAPIIGKAAVLCKFILDGTVSPEEKDEVTEILNTAKEKVGELGGLSLLCTSVTGCAAATEASPIEVWPVGLPWLTKVETMESEPRILDKITDSSGGPGWEILCLVLGVNTEDSCRGTVGAKLEGTEATGLLSILSAESGKSNCTAGGEASGVETGEGTVSLVNGKTLGLLVCLSGVIGEYESFTECILGIFKGIYKPGYNDIIV